MKKKDFKRRRQRLLVFLLSAVFAAGLKDAEDVKAEKAMPKDPVHNCTKKDDGTDATEWDYVYFGSYPQTEILNVTDAVANARYDSDGNAVVDGVKYRRISENDTNDGGYEFGTGTEYRYFKWEPIKWKVLENDGETLLLLADNGLDCKNYNQDSIDWDTEEGLSVTWEDCMLRSWLNDSFYYEAFQSDEREDIMPAFHVNEDHPDYGTNGGNVTTDDVWLLSISEVSNPDYGFCSDRSVQSASRWTHVSDYANRMGAGRDSEGDGDWWLRSPGRETNYASQVYSDGCVYDGEVDEYFNSVVPALYVDVASDCWTMAEGGGENSEITFDGPKDVSVKNKENASFSIHVSGNHASDYTYQWYFSTAQQGNGTKIEGANSSVYTLQSADTSQNGRYFYCVVSDGTDTKESSRAKLTVYWAPTVTDPSPVYAGLGKSATFRVTASGGNPAQYTYQWYYYPSRNSGQKVKVAGATAASYTIPSVTEDMDGRFYCCAVSNGVYEVMSEHAVRLVVKLKQTIKASSCSKAIGSSSYLNARANGDGSLSFTSSNPSVASIDSLTGRITAKKYGTTKITITASGVFYYSAKKTITVKVVPKKGKLTKASSPGSRKLSLKWKKDKSVTGYELNISLNKKFKKNTIKRTYKKSQTAVSVVGFASGKTYFIRTRSYAKVGKKKYYSGWSKTKRVKIK